MCGAPSYPHSTSLLNQIMHGHGPNVYFYVYVYAISTSSDIIISTSTIAVSQTCLVKLHFMDARSAIGLGIFLLIPISDLIRLTFSYSI